MSIKHILLILLAGVCGFASIATAQVRTDLYFDPTDQRTHADVKSQITQNQLRLRVSAVGEGVDSLPGFTGVNGTNLQTAYELDQLIKGDLVEILTFSSTGLSQGVGNLIPRSRGRISTRQLSYEGVISYDELSNQVYWLSFDAIGPPLKKGNYRTEIWARGELRLGIEIAINADGSGTVIDFIEVPHAETFPKNAGGLFRFVSTEVDETYIAPITEVDWQKRDIESKWVAFKKSTSDGGNLKHWIHFLSTQKDYAFLELVGFYQIDAINLFGVGDVLSKANSTGWLALIHWIRGEKPPTRGHGWTAMDGLFLAEDQQDVVYSWIKKHKLEAAYTTILQTIEGRKIKPKLVDVSKYKAPHQFASLLKSLDPPKSIETLKLEATESDPKQVYLHQVLRAIDAVVVANKMIVPEVQTKFKMLRTHPHERIRQAVYLAYTYGKTAVIPTDLMAVTNNEQETDKVREAAFLAHSYRAEPLIYPDVIAMAKKLNHPAWKAAMSRLSETLADGFAVEQLQVLEFKKGADFHAASIEKSQKRIDSKLQNPKAIKPYFTSLFMKAAWLKHSEHPLAESYYQWLGKQVNLHRGDLTDFFESDLVKTKFPSGVWEDAAKLNAILKQLSNELSSKNPDK